MVVAFLRATMVVLALGARRLRTVVCLIRLICVDHPNVGDIIHILYGLGKVYSSW